jgi:hypothetical protein
MVIRGALFAVLIIIGVVALVALWRKLTTRSSEAGQRTPISGLKYCGDDDVKPCVVSFGVDMDDNMIVNILVPSLTYPNYYLTITRNGTTEKSNYECLRVRSSPNSTYCIGPKMPPGETLHLTLVSTRDETILATGDLSIIALALPTLEILTSTPAIAPTEPTAMPAPTETFDFALPTSATPATATPTPPQPAKQTQTPTQESYPNPSYP